VLGIKGVDNMPGGPHLNWEDKRILEAGRTVINKLYNKELKNQFCLEIEFKKLTGYRQSYQSILKHIKEGGKVG